ncbi:putative transposase for insertion sequence element IS986/IS6110 [Mycobacterium tuberculosis]|nr:putative transposase for insertion sequence element IS986/IS6110 [Mycobacterium tuberculosis]
MLTGRRRAIRTGLHQPRHIRHIGGHKQLSTGTLPHPGPHRGHHRAQLLRHSGVLDLKDVIHHTDRGSQYTSIRFSERLAEAGIQPSVGAVGSSYDNALAETINGLYKTELIKPGKPWRSIEDVELATARWVDWFNHRRLYQYCGDVPPVELEAAYYAQRQRPAAG